MKKINKVSTLLQAITVALVFGCLTMSVWGFVVSLIATAILSNAYAGHNMAFAACGAIASGNAATCSTIPTAGLEVDLYLANRDDIDWDASTIVGRTITALVMKSTKELYKFTGLKNTNASGISCKQGKYKPEYTHTLSMIIHDNTAATKEDIIEKFATANLVAIVRSKSKGTLSNTECELLGRDVGLQATGLDKKSDDADAPNAWKCVFGPAEGEFEGNAGYIVHDTDQATTLAMLDAITSAS